MMLLAAGIMFTILALFLGDSVLAFISDQLDRRRTCGWSWSASRLAGSSSSSTATRSSGASSKATSNPPTPAGRDRQQRPSRSMPVLRPTGRLDRTPLPRLRPGRGGRPRRLLWRLLHQYCRHVGTPAGSDAVSRVPASTEKRDPCL